jgi:GNAT superfamily N-acetyltransferase
VEAQVRIRRILPDEGWLLRELRLRSLFDAPDAFGEPFEEAGKRPDAEWQLSARRSAEGDANAWLVAERDEQPVGLVRGRRRRPSTLLLFSMWVDPLARRAGVGRRLIEGLEAWASTWSGRETVLWVIDGNHDALAFYEQLGFRIIEEGEDAEAGRRHGALTMTRAIDASGAQPD